MRAAVYHRVSTVDQDPAAARSELRAHAQRIGARIVLDVEEVGSGALNNRPGFLEVMKASKRRDVDVVIVWALDRFGRSALDVLESIKVLGDAGVRFIATSQSLDVRPGGDPMSALTVTVLAAVAQFERAMISERTRVGMRAARGRGSRLGRPRVPELDVELVLELLARGMTTAQVAAELGTTPWAVRLAKRSDLPSRPRARAAAILEGRGGARGEIRLVARSARSDSGSSSARADVRH